MNRLRDRRETYRGGKAKRYEETRQGEFWDLEQAAMARILDGFGTPGMPLLDCPVGTGRFLPLYDELGLMVVGVDLSPDMLKQAERKGSTATLLEGSLFDLNFDDDAFDVAVCVRFLNWLQTDELTDALTSLSRVAPLVIAGAGTKNGDVPLRSVQCIHEEPDWLDHVEAAGLTVRERHVVQLNDRGDFHFWELAR